MGAADKIATLTGQAKSYLQKRKNAPDPDHAREVLLTLHFELKGLKAYNKLHFEKYVRPAKLQSI